MIEQLCGFLIALAVGVIVALTGYFLNIKAQQRERKERAKEQLINAGRSILSELKANLKIAEQPLTQNCLMPFMTTMLGAHTGEITRLPNYLQSAIYQTYVEIAMGNAIVQTDLQKITWGGGDLNERYKAQCKKIIEVGDKSKQCLEAWLKKESGEDAIT